MTNSEDTITESRKQKADSIKRSKARTLKSEIHLLICKYGLLEFCDRFADACFTQSELEQDSDLQPVWAELVRCLEYATENASQLTAAKEAQEVKLWH